MANKWAAANKKKQSQINKNVKELQSYTKSYDNNREKYLGNLYETLGIGKDSQQFQQHLNVPHGKFGVYHNSNAWEVDRVKELKAESDKNFNKLLEEKYLNIPKVPIKKSESTFTDLINKNVKKNENSNIANEKYDKSKSYNPYIRMGLDTEEDFQERLKEAENNKVREFLLNNPVSKGIKSLADGVINAYGETVGELATIGDKEGKENLRNYLDKVESEKTGVNKTLYTIGDVGTNIANMSALSSKIPFLNKLDTLTKSSIVNNALKEGLENVIVEGGLDLAKGNTENFIKNRVGDFGSGAVFGGVTEGLGQGISKLKGLKNTKVDIPDVNKVDVPKVETKLPDSPVLSKVETPKTDIVKAETPKVKVEKPDLSDVEFKYDNRTFENLPDMGNRKVKSITENMGELKPFIKNQAEMVLQDMRFGTKGGEVSINHETGERFATSRLANETFEIIQAQTGKTYAEIKAALKKVANGEVNDALTKRIELILDDSLINGTRLADGIEIPANKSYIETKRLYEELSKGNLNVLYEPTNVDNVKEHFTPMNIENDSDKLSEVVKATSDEIASSKVDERAFTQLEDNMGLSRHASVTMPNSENITPEFKEVINQYEFDYFKANNQADYD